MNQTITGLHRRLTNSNLISEIYPSLYYKLREKGERIKTNQDIEEKEINFYQHLCLPKEINNLSQLSSEDMKLLLKKEINIKFELMKREGKLEKIIWDKDENDWFESYRVPGKLVFLNQHISTRNRRKIQVYSSPTPISYQYNKHCPNSSGSASKFNKGINPEEVDLLVFNNGVGHLDITQPEEFLFMYLKFSEEIGTTKDKKPTQYVKAHIKNCRFSKGYIQEIHSFPVSEKEIMDNKMKELKRSIDMNVI